MQKIVILSGAGISAESGVSTFRDNGGLWENHKIEDVATPEAWERNQDLVLQFYNERRKNALSVLPNSAHKAIVELESAYQISVITQNVDDLHERAGTKNVLHLHGELFKVRSTIDSSLVYTLEGWELKKGDFCEKGSQLRPHIVWFGEAVPLIEDAIQEVLNADIMIIIGTSLAVYPAAGLIQYVDRSKPIYIIDPVKPDIKLKSNMVFIQEKATLGMETLLGKLLK